MSNSPDPKDLGALLGSPQARIRRRAAQDERIYGEGITEGRAKLRKELVDFLHKKYMEPTLVRESAEAKAILKLTAEVVKFLEGKH